ncbi:MAG: phosphatidylglycerophosphatase A family protein [Acidobacteriota bacterium]
MVLIARALVTGLGVGYLPLAPGTWGSLEGVFLVLALSKLFPSVTLLPWVIFLVLTVLGVFCATSVSAWDNDPDPASVVIDEVAGQMLCLLFVPVSAFSLTVGFFLFRAFDVVKPFPARRFESLPGGFGIVADDLVAGLYAGTLLWIVTQAFGA